MASVVVHTPPPPQPLQWPFLETSLRSQFRTDETAGMRYAFLNGVRHAHVHRAAAGPSLYSDRARSRPWQLSNDNQPSPPPAPKRFECTNTSDDPPLPHFAGARPIDISLVGTIVWISWQLRGQRKMYGLTFLQNDAAGRAPVAECILEAAAAGEHDPENLYAQALRSMV